MRIYKLIGALVVVLAFSALTIVATASAEEILWKWLPGSVGETFTGKSGKATLFGETKKSKIVCEKSLVLLTWEKLSSELLKEGSTEGKDATLALAFIHFEGCKVEGIFPMESLGDASEVILAHLEIHNCMIKKGHFGLLIKTLPVHVEVLVANLLILLEGAFIALIEPLPKDELKNHFLLNIKMTEGLQELKLCEGGKEDTLTAKDDAEPVENTSEEALEGLLLFDRTIDKEGETMMEK
jgi:hypothetical protein